jgi:hypothetical protein
VFSAEISRFLEETPLRRPMGLDEKRVDKKPLAGAVQIFCADFLFFACNINDPAGNIPQCPVRSRMKHPDVAVNDKVDFALSAE